MGIVVFDIEDDYKPVRRIPTWDPPAAGQEAENVKGIAANAKTGIVYVSTIKRVGAFDIVSGKKLWDKTYEGGCDRIALSPDGKILYVPSLEGPHWTVVNATNGDVIAKIEPKSGAHNTIYAPDGSRVYMAGLKSNLLTIADPKTNTVVGTVGPFANPIRPFTVNGSNTLVFVNVNSLLGFEVGDVKTGKKLYRVEVQGFEAGPVKRHGCPTHGIALTPDEKELWVADGAQQPHPHLRRDGDAAEAGHEHPGARPARLDHVQHRREDGVVVERRGDRREDEEDRGAAEGRCRATSSRARRCWRS